MSCGIVQLWPAPTKRPYGKAGTTQPYIPYIILLFEQFSMSQLFVSLCLKCVLVIGHCGRRNIKVPSVKNPELMNVFPKSTEQVRI